jgi:hypothetical protein
MDSKLHFEWPNNAGRRRLRAPADTARPFPQPPTSVPQERAPYPPAVNLERLLEDARTTIARLEVDRRAARTRIDELEAERDACHARLTAQRQRLLLLERQLEGVGASPVTDGSPPRASWLNRLLGGTPRVPIA